MERCFIVTKESKYFKDYEEFSKKEEQQSEFCKKFLDENSVEGNTYMVGGNGFMNVPFTESDKSEIGLSVEPTENNLSKFNKMLCKPGRHGLCSFKKSSKISKEFSQECVDEKIVINLYSPRVSDCFVSLKHGMYGCSSQRFSYEDNLYIKIGSEHLAADDTPDGFIEIKTSEYYRIAESLS